MRRWEWAPLSLVYPVPNMWSWVLSFRWLMLIAAIGTALGAVLMFWIGVIRIVTGFAAVVAGGTKPAIIAVMGATDAFIFGLVLLIFSFAITFGFVSEMPQAMQERLPRWIPSGGVAGLSRAMMEVIVVYLTVDFVTDIAEQEGPGEWTLLIMPVSIILIAGALRLLHGPSSS